MDFSIDPGLERIAAEATKLAADFDDEYWSQRGEAHDFP